MKIVAFLGEAYVRYGDSYVAQQTSAAFLQSVVGPDCVYVCSSVKENPNGEIAFSSEVPEDKFYEFPLYTSTKGFLVSYICSRAFRRQYRSLTLKVISEHPGAVFWVRSPSIGSLFFALEVLRADRKLFHHICADISNTWRDAKYGYGEKLLAFVFSRYLRRVIRKICRHPNTTNLCTGRVLEDFSKKVAPHRTFQFVDLLERAKYSPFCPQRTVQNVCTFLFVGRIVEDKGIFDILDVLARSDLRARLIVVGDGPDFDAAHSLAERLGLADRVYFVGQVPYAKLSEFYGACDLVIVPSKNRYEGFPRVIMESWGYGKPIIVSDVGGIRAFVENGENGIVFPPGDLGALKKAMETAATDADLYARLRAGVALCREVSDGRYWQRVLSDQLKANANVA